MSRSETDTANRCPECGIVPETIRVGEQTMTSCGKILDGTLYDQRFSPCTRPTTNPVQSDRDVLAKQCAEKHDKLLREGKGQYATDAEYISNYFGRLGGFKSGWDACQGYEQGIADGFLADQKDKHDEDVKGLITQIQIRDEEVRRLKEENEIYRETFEQMDNSQASVSALADIMNKCDARLAALKASDG